MQKWNELSEKFSHVTDKAGTPIDAGIFETIIALNALDIPTTMSCEGHLNRGSAGPWVAIGMQRPPRPDTPETRQLEMRLWELTMESDEEREQRKRTNTQLCHKLFGYLRDFYQNRHVPFDRT